MSTESVAPNPYQSPETSIAAASPEGRAADRATRLALLPRESAVRSVGLLGYATITALALPGSYLLLVAFGVLRSAMPAYGAMQFVQLFGLLGGIILAASVALRHLRAGVRWPVLGFVGMELFLDVSSLIQASYLSADFHLGEGWARVSLVLRIVVGTSVIVALFWPGQGRVCSREYRRVVRATPEVRCPTARWAWVLMALVVGEVALLLTGYAVVLTRPR